MDMVSQYLYSKYILNILKNECQCRLPQIIFIFNVYYFFSIIFFDRKHFFSPKANQF